MEVKIGIQFGTRELTVDVDESAEDVLKRLEDVLNKGGVFTVNDHRGGSIMVPVDKLAYIEIEKPGERSVGFVPRM